ncbi:MAG: hypothetical protein J07HQW1_00022, partial [Haloquadratum walsbyi J07HQW1]
NRIVEYQRVNNTWLRTWTWGEGLLSWPRDADRLPNGNTLITDSNGGRVIEVNKQGNIVWSVEMTTPYEAERLGTGDESSGGQSADTLGLESQNSLTAGISGSENKKIESRQ